MKKNTVLIIKNPEAVDLVTQLIREGAHRLIAEAIEAEVESFVFKSALIPPYMRRTATIEKVLPLLYLKGVSERNFAEVLSPIFGESANNLSPSVISHLKNCWEEELTTWGRRPLRGKQWVYWWVDGIGFPARDEERRCVLVVFSDMLNLSCFYGSPWLIQDRFQNCEIICSYPRFNFLFNFT